MSSHIPSKILAIQFKYFGDVVFITPALRTLKEHYGAAEIHVLVAAEIAPLLENIFWIKKVWAMPRVRGKATLSQSWPLVMALRNERFDMSIDFGGNDRGAILSFLSGAPKRLSYSENKRKLIRKICYTHTRSIDTLPRSYVAMHIGLLASYGIPAPSALHLEIISDPNLTEDAKKILSNNTILCHIGTSQTKKEWPLSHWQKLSELAKKAGYQLAFSSGPNEREQSLLNELKQLDSDITLLPTIKNLKLFLAVLKNARMVISGDTGPLHFAAGLGVPIIGLYAVEDSVRFAAPNYAINQVVMGRPCACSKHPIQLPICTSNPHCMSLIQPEQVMAKIKTILNT